MGEKVIHANFGEGEVTHTFGSGEKISIAVKFIGMGPRSWIHAWPQSNPLELQYWPPCFLFFLSLPSPATQR